MKLELAPTEVNDIKPCSKAYPFSVLQFALKVIHGSEKGATDLTTLP